MSNYFLKEESLIILDSNSTMNCLRMIHQAPEIVRMVSSSTANWNNEEASITYIKGGEMYIKGHKEYAEIEKEYKAQLIEKEEARLRREREREKIEEAKRLAYSNLLLRIALDEED